MPQAIQEVKKYGQVLQFGVGLLVATSATTVVLLIGQQAGGYDDPETLRSWYLPAVLLASFLGGLAGSRIARVFIAMQIARLRAEA